MPFNEHEFNDDRVCVNCGNSQNDKKLGVKCHGYPVNKIPDWFAPALAKGREADAQNAVKLLLSYIGEDPERGGLRDTPARIIKSYEQLFWGYKVDVAKIFTTFEENHDEMVILKDIEFTSFCEHHWLPFVGHAAIGYVPDGKIVGISKLARLLDVFTHRLQVQERITNQVTEAINEHLKPLGSACVLEASHFCMVCRGVGKQHSKMITSSMTGCFRDKPEARAEFLACVRGTG